MERIQRAGHGGEFHDPTDRNPPLHLQHGLTNMVEKQHIHIMIYGIRFISFYIFTVFRLYST